MVDRFVHAYLGDQAAARAFLPGRFDAPEDRARAVEAVAGHAVRPDVLRALRAQNAALGDAPAREKNLEDLGRPGTVCVVTGQQVGLFGGPLYTIYKAASAIVTARALEAETGRRAVPVFWLQSEDHDYEEIATAWLPGTGGEAPVALTVPSEGGSDRVSIAHRRLGPDVTLLFVELDARLGDRPEVPTALGRLANRYGPSNGWVEAFAGWLAELFAQEGLLFLNPRDPALAGAAAEVHRVAVEFAGPIADGLTARADELAQAGFSVPVHIRPGAPLSFFHPDGPEGPRYRFEPDGEGWQLVGRDAHVGAAQMSDALEARPRDFSTSALLRPILQDHLLPTAAYVGGPGEIDYFAQLAPLYAAYDLPMPIVAPRARFVLVEPKARARLDELGLSASELDRPEAELLARVARRPEGSLGPEAVEARLLEGFRAQLEALGPELTAAGPHLGKAADRTRATVEQACGKLVDKYRAALDRGDAQRLASLRALQAALHPKDAPQERIFGLTAFAAQYGDRAIVEAVLERARPYHPDLEPLDL